MFSKKANNAMRFRITPIVMLAVVLIVVTGLVHAVDMSDAFAEMTYKGLLFLANALGAMVVAGGLLVGRRWGWWLGLLVAGGAALGYVASRTLGLPGLPAEPDAWLEPLGMLSLVAEVGFVALAAHQLAIAPQRRPTLVGAGD